MKIKWDDHQRPFSEKFQDIYYSSEGGLNETRYVFIENNHLITRLQSSSRDFVIGELGFGTGLNFLTTLKTFKDIQSKKASQDQGWLHYYSFEKFLLSIDDMKRALESWPELENERNQFLEVYRELPSGFHRFDFVDAKVSLTLMVGDISKTIHELSARIDAWYLDGFSPDKNPEMWDEMVFRKMAELSSTDATFSTYTSAGWVSRNLVAAGFEIEKVKGFGKKREMLRGRLSSSTTPSNFQRGRAKDTKIIVIGAGLAGCSVAHALAKRGYKVLVLESQSGIASAASGNAAAITLPTLTAEPTVLSKMGFSGYTHLYQKLNQLKPQIKGGSNGLLQLLIDEKKSKQWVKGLSELEIPESMARVVDSHEASKIAGVSLTHSAIYFSNSQFLNLRDLSTELITNFSHVIDLRLQIEAIDLQQTHQGWRLKLSNNETLESDIVVLTNAFEIQKFEISSWLPLRKVRGQVAHLKSNENLSKLKSILCFESYLTPTTRDGFSILGASYDRENLDAKIRDNENEQLIEKLRIAVAGFSDSKFEVHSSRVAYRTSVAGQEPVIGQMHSKDGQKLEGLFVSTAFTSRGSLYAPLAGEIIASQIASEPSPIEKSLHLKIDVSRFLSC